jgi:hypothetical protein
MNQGKHEVKRMTFVEFVPSATSQLAGEQWDNEGFGLVIARARLSIHDFFPNK